eukprot:m.155076 g.155076  ORF g.155076 m.155076 type:complete len:689 (-) comp16405_c0_seq4:959-3025(-)
MGNTALCRCADVSHDLVLSPRSRADASMYRPARANVDHDMSQPLAHYYIWSSSNSYLVANATSKGKTGLQTIELALEFGCRAIELTVHSTRPGWLSKLKRNPLEPVVFHNGYAQAPLSLQTCLETILANAFLSSPYPLLLCLDDHCTPAGKERLAQLLEQTLGSYLHRPAATRRHQYESPASLQHKILLFHHDRLRAKRHYRGCPDSMKRISYVLTTEFAPLSTSRFSTAAAGSVFDDAVLAAHSQDGASTLKEHTYRHLVLRNSHDAELETANTLNTHVYEQGVQLEGLQWHLMDEAVWVAHGRFSTDNGGCGYLLKPAVLRSETIPPNLWPTAKQPHSTQSLPEPCFRAEETPPSQRSSLIAASPVSPLSHFARLPLSTLEDTAVLSIHLRSAYLPHLLAVQSDAYVIVKLFDFGQPVQTLTSSLASQLPGRCRFDSRLKLSVHHPSTSVLLLQVQLCLQQQPQPTDYGCRPRTSSLDRMTASRRSDGSRSDVERTYGHFALALNTLATGPALLPLLDAQCQPLPEACLGVDMDLHQDELCIVSPEVTRRRRGASSRVVSPLRLPTLEVCVKEPMDVQDTEHSVNNMATNPADMVQDDTDPAMSLAHTGAQVKSGCPSPPPEHLRQRAYSSPVKPEGMKQASGLNSPKTSTNMVGRLSQRVSQAASQAQSPVHVQDSTFEWDTISL